MALAVPWIGALAVVSSLLASGCADLFFGSCNYPPWRTEWIDEDAWTAVGSDRDAPGLSVHTNRPAASFMLQADGLDDLHPQAGYSLKAISWDMPGLHARDVISLTPYGRETGDGRLLIQAYGANNETVVRQGATQLLANLSTASSGEQEAMVEALLASREPGSSLHGFDPQTGAMTELPSQTYTANVSSITRASEVYASLSPQPDRPIQGFPQWSQFSFSDGPWRFVVAWDVRVATQQLDANDWVGDLYATPWGGVSYEVTAESKPSDAQMHKSLFELLEFLNMDYPPEQPRFQSRVRC